MTHVSNKCLDLLTSQDFLIEKPLRTAMASDDDDQKKYHGFRFVYIQNWRRWGGLPVALLCIVCLALGLGWWSWKSPGSLEGVAVPIRMGFDPPDPGITVAEKREESSAVGDSAAAADVSDPANKPRLAPMILAPPQLCGNIVEQQLQIISSMVAGVLLGAQVVLPHTMSGGQVEITDLFDLNKLQILGQRIYTKHWCIRRNIPAHHLWCAETYVPGILTHKTFSELAASPQFGRLNQVYASETMEVVQIAVRNFTEKMTRRSSDSSVDMQSLRKELWRAHFPSGFSNSDILNRKVFMINGINEKCNFYKLLKASEPGPAYRMFWEFYDALEFNNEIHLLFSKLKVRIAQDYAQMAIDRARSFNYKIEKYSQVVALEMDNKDCRVDLKSTTDPPPPDPNCFDVGNTMLSEGVSPSLPVYLPFATAKSLEKLHGTVLGSIYTLATKDMLVNTASHDPIIWAAVDVLMAAEAVSFIGPSSSVSSSLTFLARQRRQLEAFHYDGETSLLEAKGILKAKTPTGVPTLRVPIKWVFSMGNRQQPGSSAWNMTLSAVKSALTTGLLPVCLTNAQPDSEEVQFLVGLGVRVLHHTPTWAEEAILRLKQWRTNPATKWKFTFPEFADIFGEFLRIDIPIVGLLDPFVLYTDVDVMFLSAVTWPTILGDQMPFNENEYVDMTDFKYAKPGTIGLPEYFAMGTEFVQSANREKMETGVMLMNIVMLRQSHAEYMDFLFNRKQTWKYSTADPTMYKAFYRRHKKVMATFIPHALSWKVFWKPSGEEVSATRNFDPVIIHFHGPKCDDIVPFLTEGTVQYEGHRALLDACASIGTCWNFCKKYQRHLEAGYKQIYKRYQHDQERR